MGRPRVEIDLAAPGAGRHAADLSRGGLFVPGEELELNGDCEVVLHGGDAPVVVPARVVFADGSGVGIELRLDPELRAELVAIAERAPPDDAELDAPVVVAETIDFGVEDDGAWGAGEEAAAEVAAQAEADAEERAGAGAEGAAGGERGPRNVYERLRGLTLIEQYKIARTGELHERVALERIYGKTVWEQLLRNPKISPPEVARIGRMGTLPRPLLEVIVGNATWLGVPEVRRALLTNPRLTADMIPRILRHLPRHELKLVPGQLAYTAAVREAARRLVRGG